MDNIIYRFIFKYIEHLKDFRNPSMITVFIFFLNIYLIYFFYKPNLKWHTKFIFQAIFLCVLLYFAKKIMYLVKILTFRKKIFLFNWSNFRMVTSCNLFIFRFWQMARFQKIITTVFIFHALKSMKLSAY